jgi:hypothetical protein
MSAYELAQLNIGVTRGPMDSPVMAQFAASLERINALADASPGFVWRLQTEDGNATSIQAFPDPNQLVNMSVWRDVHALRQYVYHSEHLALMRRRREWFTRMEQAYMVLWWVPRGHRPTVGEAIERLEALRHKGAHAFAFTFTEVFPAPDAAGAQVLSGCSDECPAT